MNIVAALLLVLYLADGLLSVAVAVVDALAPLHIVQMVVALATLCCVVLAHAIQPALPSLPGRFIWGLSLPLLWLTFTSGFPLPLWLATDSLAVATAFVEIAVGLAVWLAWRAPGSWHIDVHQRQPVPWLTHFARSAAFNVAALPVVVLISGGLGAVALVEHSTGGYVRLRWDGLHLEERLWQRDNDQVRLVGMIHLGDDAFYHQVAPRGEPNLATIVLVEGVTDRDDLLGQTLELGRLARMAGLTAQSESVFMDALQTGRTSAQSRRSRPLDHWRDEAAGIDFVRADVDVSDFSADTQRFLESAGRLLSAASLSQAAMELADPHSPLNNPRLGEAVQRDIHDRRNDTLFSHLERALATHDRIVVPWGALHLPDIEERLKERGFAESQRILRLAVPFPWARRLEDPAPATSATPPAPQSQSDS